MNILIIGGLSSITDQLIKKFNKEGHRVSLLTGSYHVKGKYPHVFERYDFPYSSEVLPEIFESVNPDITVFIGAYDSNFTWADPNHESVNYVSAVMNIMMAFSGLKRGRFVYISSDMVYAPDMNYMYSEEDETNSLIVKGSALTQAESICKKFMSDPDLDIIVVRLGGYYHFPKQPDDVEDAIAEMCIEYLKTGQFPFKEKRLVMPLNDADAVFFLSLVILSGTHKHECYNISSGNTYTTSYIEEKIRETAEKSGYVIPDSTKEEEEDTETKRHKGLFSRVKGHVEIGMDVVRNTLKEKEGPSRLDYPQTMLDIRRFRDEFGINRLSDFEKDLIRIITHIIKNKELFLHVEEKKKTFLQWLKERFGWILHVVVPFLENFIAFIPFFLLNNRAVDSKYFARIDFFLLYVLLFAVLYGQHQATLSALLATVGFLYRQMYNKTGAEVLLDYNTYVWIAQLFIVGLSVGYLKDKLYDQKLEAIHDHEHMAKQVDDIREINGSNVRVKDALQTQLINHDDSIGKIYEITSTLDRYSADEVLFYAADILRKIMGSDDIALYRVTGGPYARLFTATTELSRKLGNSIKYESLDELYAMLSDGKPFINRKLDENLPMMASGIYEGDEIRMIIMIWKLPWEKMTLGQANILTVTGALIQNAVIRANRYLDALHSERYIKDTIIMTKKAFVEIEEIYRKASEQALTAFVIYRIKNIKSMSFQDISKKLSSLLRNSDYLGIGEDDELYILLTNTTTLTAGPAIERLTNAGIEAEYIVS